MKPRVLIVGTVPYNKRSTSRAFDSYFHYWEKENLAQVFSHAKKPTKGHCSTFYQITDQQLIQKRLKKIKETGTIYFDEDIEEEWETEAIEVKSSIFKKLYKYGKRKTSFTHYLRKFVWKKAYWCTEKFNKWLDDFNPECVFLSFSDDFFILEIALYVANRYNIPIVSSIGDDYYFNKKFSLSPFYHLYKSQYKKLVEKVLSVSGSAIYIGNKIRDQYNNYFKLDGETVYLTSSLKRREFQCIDVNAPKITYCGNIRCGRYLSLLDIADALKTMGKRYVLDVYSGELDEKYIKVLQDHPNVCYHGAVPYAEVLRITENSDIVVIVEGTRKKDIYLTKYSLSTKVADALCSGSNLFAYGAIECGAIEYLQESKACEVCTDKKWLVEKFLNFIEDKERQKNYYENAIMAGKNHILEQSCEVFEEVIRHAIEKVKKC